MNRNVIKTTCSVAIWYGYLHLWTPPQDSLLNIEMKISPHKILTDITFPENVIE
jgi:hypothetical protein